MAITQRYHSIEKGHMLVTGNTLMIYQANIANGGPFTTVNAALQVPGYPAGTTLNWQDNSSMATMVVPADATVLHAELTWTSLLTAGIFDYSAFKDDPITFITPAVSTTVVPQFGETTNDIYTRSADVTALVQAGGSGEYTVGMVAGLNGIESTSVPSGNAAGWYLSVVLGVPTESNKLFQINVGNAFVPGQSTLDFTIDGFSTPVMGPVTGRLFAGIQRGDPSSDIITIFTGPDTANLNYQLSRPPMPDDNMIAGFISNTETNAVIDTSGTFGNNNNTPGNPPVAQPFARWHIDIATFDISPSLSNSQTTLVTRSISMAPAAVFDYNVYNLQIEVQAPDVTATKEVDKAFADVGEVLNYTVTVTNSGQIEASNVVITDILPTGTSFVPGTVIVDNVPIPAADITTGVNIGIVSEDGGTSTITFSAQVDAIADPNPAVNTATVDYEFIPVAGAEPISATTTTNEVSTIVRSANLTGEGNFVKSVAPENATIGDILTYTITVTNSGNVSANNVVITDAIPAGTSYVDGSVSATVAFSGTPATGIALTAPIAANASVTITFQVKVGDTIPAANPILNTASISYSYTVDPAEPNGVTDSGNSNTVSTQISSANLVIVKKSDKSIAYIDDVITYQIAVTNTGNVPANNVVISDSVPNGTAYIPNTLIASVPFSGSPETTISLTNPIAPLETVSLSFQIKVTAIPNPNPIVNIANAEYTYTVDPLDPNGVSASSASNAATTIVFKNNYSQQISDLIESIALEEAAIGNIANAEGAKIQKMISLQGVTPNQLLCLNKSVTDTLESLTILASILKQKLSSVDCQINGTFIC